MFVLSKGSHRAILIVLALILSGIAFFRGYYGPDTTTWIPAITKGHGSNTAILGKHEDPERLYFPPKTPHVPSLQIAKYVEPPSTRPRTPLFIGFTNNNAMLVQCVLSYIAAGWPPSDIIIVENTPTMDSNARGTLDKDNYFFLDYPLLRSYGVSILQTPVLFTFSQLQNFYMRTALAYSWPNFFWSHMDVVAVADENPPFTPFYQGIIDVLTAVQAQPLDSWAMKWFSCTLSVKACDMLVLINVHVWATKIGAWDPFIPYYISDCDAFSRMALHGYTRDMATDHKMVGHVFDVGSLLPGDDPVKWLFPATEDEQPNSERYQKLFKELQDMEGQKLGGNDHRNDWQENHGTMGTIGEENNAWGSYDRTAFRTGFQALSEVGISMYLKKWGTILCGLDDGGTKLEDMWKPLHEEVRKNKEEKEKQEQGEGEEEEDDG